jgi:hypothetical protein
MRRRREVPTVERTEAEIRSWIRGRDPGNAPERLRMRIARVVETDRARRTGYRAMVRPAIALGAVAAAGLLFAIGLGLRGAPVSGPAASGPGPAASPTPLTSPGLWHGTVAVLALPLDGPLLAAVIWALFVGALLLLAYLARRSFADVRQSDMRDLSWRGLWRIRSPRGWLFRAAGMLMAVALLVVGANLFQLSQEQPLVYGSSLGGPTQMLGWRSSTGGDSIWRQDGYVAFTSGGQFEVDVSIRNDGNLPLTVTSFDEARFLSEQPAGAFISSVDLRLLPGPGWDGQAGMSYSEPFHPFELQPRDETSMAMTVHLKECTAAAPGPTPAPSPYAAQYLPTTGHVGFGELPFRYSILGLEREVDVPMFGAIVLVFGSSEVVC